MSPASPACRLMFSVLVCMQVLLICTAVLLNDCSCRILLGCLHFLPSAIKHKHKHKTNRANRQQQQQSSQQQSAQSPHQSPDTVTLVPTHSPLPIHADYIKIRSAQLDNDSDRGDAYPSLSPSVSPCSSASPSPCSSDDECADAAAADAAVERYVHPSLVASSGDMYAALAHYCFGNIHTHRSHTSRATCTCTCAQRQLQPYTYCASRSTTRCHAAWPLTRCIELISGTCAVVCSCCVRYSHCWYS